MVTMTADATAETHVCAICGDSISLAMSAECNWCDRRYHLNQRNDVPDARDCGQVWIDEQFLALQFACNDCLAGNHPTTPSAPRSAPAGRRRYRKRA